MDDKQLIENCLDGDVDEFRKIVDKYRGKAMALALNILWDQQDAEDACQDVFIKIYLNLDNFDFKKSFSTWFYSNLYNRCLDYLRKRRRFYKLFKRVKSDHFLLDDTKNSSSFELQSVIKGTLKDLSPKERTVLFLWVNEGYTSEEIASVMKCSSSTARVHLFKARRKIKAVLEKENVSMQGN